MVQIRSSIEPSASLKHDILQEMHATCELKSIPASSVPHHVVTHSAPCTRDNGRLTASAKLRRLGIETRLAKEVDALYEASQRGAELSASTLDHKDVADVTLTDVT